MGQQRTRLEFRVDAYTRVCLTVIAVLLTVLIVGLWAERVPSSRPALGAPDGIPNAGLQRQVMIKTLEKNNEQLSRLIDLFESGKAKVQVEQKEQDPRPKRAPAIQIKKTK